MNILLAAVAAVSILLAPAEQKRVAEQAASLIEQRYVDPAIGKSTARALRSARWEGQSDGKAFARRLTQFLRDASKDGHLAVEFSEKPIKPDGGEASFAASELERWYGAHLNHGVEKIERLDGNIMLLDLRVFPPPAMAGDVIASAMTLVAQGDALIIDLRQNGGGMETVNLLLSYLLPPGTPLNAVYDRPSNRTTPSTTAAWVPGRRFDAKKPIYVLTGKRTFSAAEAVAYDLQANKRATIVGEVTGGGANPFEYRRINDHFALSLPEQRSINPITGTNWQGVGVKPDIVVPAGQALDAALKLAREAIAKGRSADGSDPRSLP
jgi:hypothetical protein